MKDANKIPRNFRIRNDINAALRKMAEQTGISETRLVEDALRAYLSGGLRRQLEQKLVKLPDVSFKLPTVAVAA